MIGNLPISGGSDSQSVNGLRRVDNGLYEVPLDDVVYYSPEQHGGRNGNIYRIYLSHASLSANAKTTIHTFPQAVNVMSFTAGGLLSSTNEVVSIPHASAVAGYQIGIWYETDTHDVIVRTDTNSSLTWCRCFIDYYI